MVERAPELLEEHGLLDEGETRAAVLLRDRDPGPAELGELLPRRLRVGGEERPGLLAERVLLGCEGEVHVLVLPAADTPMLRAAANTSHAVVLSRANILEYWRSLRPRPARFSPANHDRICDAKH